MPDATNGQGPASADEFDRELRELTEGTAGEPLFFEPSAAERARAATVRVRRASRRNFRLAGVLFAVAVLIGAAVLAWLEYTHSPNSAGGGASSARTVPTPELMGTISPIDLFNRPPADPFRGTPADHWADGAAGIVAPAARPAGEFTAKQVAAAYATARSMLIAANLDMQTLLGGPPAALARLLTRAQRATFLAGLNKTGTDEHGNPLSTRTWVASFAPGSTELIGGVIKVHGSMTARTVRQSGVTALAIRVNYLFAYAIQPPRDPSDWMRVVDHEYGDIDFARPDGPAGALAPRDQATIARAGIQCGTGDGYSHPAYPSDWSAGTRQSGPTVHPYSLAPPRRGMECASTTAT